jgi:hypothetical protein
MWVAIPTNLVTTDRGCGMKIWIIIHLEEGDNVPLLVDKLVNTLTASGMTRKGQTISYERMGNALIIFRKNGVPVRG